MNALVKKEIRLLLPSWAVAMLLALPPICTRSDDGFPVVFLFFGMAIMALASLGRETSLNTFSTMLAQPMERLRIWQTKLSVLATAFLTVFIVWRLAIVFSFKDYGGGQADPETSAAVLVAGSLVVAATFSGGLWATLLLRQIAGAFWLTLLVPATLAGFTAAFLAESLPGSGVIAALCVILGVYSIGGFFLARWLFFRAQDVGWTGGIITLPQWKIFAARSGNLDEIRSRKPLAALLKKEIQLQQVSLMGAAGLFVLHVGVLILRTHHKFPRDSAGEILTSIFWLLWLVLPVVVGAISVAEERRLGVMEGQLCLPASRRRQFIIKGFITLCLGIFFGGVMPCLLEQLAGGFTIWHGGGERTGMLCILGLAVWLSLVSFFASSLARNFLQAVGFALGAFVAVSLPVPSLMNGMNLFQGLPVGSILPFLIAAPTLVITLLLLAYLNYKNFRDGWHLWRRNLLGFGGAILFVSLSSTAIYNRVWEFYQPVEPAHGPAKFSLANPPLLHLPDYHNVLVRLPDGRVWFNALGGDIAGYDGESFGWHYLVWALLHPLPESRGPARFVGGSNWVAATTEHVDFGGHSPSPGKYVHSHGYLDTVGIQSNGTLWVSGKSEPDRWTGDSLHQFGDETSWKQLVQSGLGVVLLKNDGTLWRWGAVSNAWQDDWSGKWPGLDTFTPHQIGTDSDWAELFTPGRNVLLAKKTDGRMWLWLRNWRYKKDELQRETNYDEITLQTASLTSEQQTAFVRGDGTLWVLNRHWDEKSKRMVGTGILQVGKASDWQAVAATWNMMVALKTDGSLWQWCYDDGFIIRAANVPPTRLGIHSDWVAVAGTWNSVIALAGDGSLWLWPDRNPYSQLLIKLPKQPQFLGNVFAAGH